jgi:hypothetical protein
VSFLQEAGDHSGNDYEEHDHNEGVALLAVWQDVA